jgi:sugar/nucleoside kinase (ribokinase family)
MIGPAVLSVGGCVGNTGIALHRLGLPAHLVARVGDDAFGTVLLDLVRAAVPRDADHLVLVPGQATSYSVVLNRPGQDRAIGHSPGVNDTFVAADVPQAVLRGAALLHVGYPPLMAALIADDGRELGDLLASGHRDGAATSIDMANANLGAADRPAWRRILARVLPEVDVCLPSLAEACHMLGRHVPRLGDGIPDLGAVGRLTDELLGHGVAIAGIKLGEHGLYLRTAPVARIAAVPHPLAAVWANRELYSSVFEADVVGTAGAGDTTIAGFLLGLLSGMVPEEALSAACAVGGSSTEAPDGTSGVPSWPEVDRRLRGGWRRRAADPGPGWTRVRGDGSWHGPRDETA